MGLNVSVYRNSEFGEYDCTNGGISSANNCLNVVNCDGPFDPKDDRPAVMIVDDRPCGRPYPKLVPAVFDEDTETWERAKGWFMFGGNYGGTSDSRFEYNILPIHDRVEA